MESSTKVIYIALAGNIALAAAKFAAGRPTASTPSAMALSCASMC
jgi:divalent metal cation (Fe/Co/Zn/Cd) transporter